MSASTKPYNSAAIVRARELRDAEWSIEKIRGLLEKEFGRKPSAQTVRCWIDEREAEKRRRLIRSGHRRRRGGDQKHKHLSEDWKIEQMTALLERSFSPHQIGLIAELWWSELLSADEVRARLGLNVMRRTKATWR